MKIPLPAVTANKDRNIETIRGIAILIIVIGHVIGADSMGGMQVPDDSVWRYMYYSVNFLGVPLFTAIAGWVYALKPVKRHGVADFLKKKARRLLLPMVFVGTLFFLVQYITPGTNTRGDLAQIWQIYVLPYTIFWYLQSLFLVFCVIALLDIFSLCSSLKSWGVVMLLAVAATFVEPHISSRTLNVFGIWGSFCILPYFLLGIAINRFPETLASKPARRLYPIVFLIGIMLFQSAWYIEEIFAVRTLWFSVFIKLVAVAFLMTLSFTNQMFIFLGHYAYSIFLFHVFGTGGGRIILKMLGIYHELPIFLFASLLGLAIPVVIDKVLSRNRITALLFLGQEKS